MNDNKDLDLATFLAVPESEDTLDNKDDKVTLAPTIENLMDALTKAENKKENHLHEGSGIKFVLTTMSSDGYVALGNVTQISPMTGYATSSNQEDEFERNIIYLTQGVSEPALDKRTATQILQRKGWGPSNVSLIDAIKNLNPSAEERINKNILMVQSSRFVYIFLHILNEVGALDDLSDKYDLTDNTREALRMCIQSFTQLFGIEYTAKAWGLPLEYDGLVNKKAKAEEDEVKAEEVKEDAETPSQEEVDSKELQEIEELVKAEELDKQEGENDVTSEHKEDSP